ncbi:MAG: hypothetical protein JNJ57_03245, partial [Saprospiraceae bacterium]|nr:hypothetical protein [Saprospiraceae bacterium]
MKNTFVFILWGIMNTGYVFSQMPLQTTWVVSKTSDSGEQAFAWGLEGTPGVGIFWAPSLKMAAWPNIGVECLVYSEVGTEIASFRLQQNKDLQAYTAAYEAGAYYVAGRSCNGFVNTCDQFLACIDLNNEQTLWTKTYDVGGNYDELDGLAIRLNDGIYLGGWGGEAGAGIYDTDLSLRKVDFQGNTLWAKTYGMPATAEHQDGHFVVDDNFIFAAGLWGGDGIANLHEGRAFLGKFSKTDGALIDSVLFGASGFWLNWENCWGMTGDEENLYLTGVSTPVAGDNQIFIACFSKNLEIQWITHWGGSGTETARAIAVNNGRVYVGGASNSANVATGGAYDAVLIVVDALTGALRSARVWGDARDNEFRDLFAADDAVYLSAASAYNLFNSVSPQTMEATLIRADLDAITSEFTISGLKHAPLLFPNPVSDKAWVRCNNIYNNLIKIQLFDQTGRLILDESYVADS